MRKSFARWSSSLLFLLLASSALAAGPGARLDPRLSGALAPGAEPVPVWVEFADKGGQGPATWPLASPRPSATCRPRTARGANGRA